MSELKDPVIKEIMTGGVPADRYPVVRLSDVERKPVEWLWHPYIPLSKLTFLEGDPEVGKSWISLAISCAITNGHTPGPGSEPLEDGPGNVLLISAEDDLGDTVGPRVDMMGGDSSRIFALKLPDFTMTEDNQPPALTLNTDGLHEVEKLVIVHNPRLVIIDPLVAYLGAEIDMHRGNETRPILAGLAAIAARNKTSILIIRHLAKARNRNAITSGIGSIDFSAAVRSVLLAGYYELTDPNDPDNRIRGRAIVQSKNNVAAHGDPLGYTIEDGRGLLWQNDPPPITAGHILGIDTPKQQPGPKTQKQDRAVEWLREFLAAGPQPVNDTKEAALENGIAIRTLERAKVEGGVESKRLGGYDKHGGWCWTLPGDPETTQGRQDVIELGNLASLGDQLPDPL